MTQFEKMTETPIPRLIIGLSIPTVISMLVTNIYNLVDTAFVGKLGTSASGAVGVVFGFMAILQAIGFMFGQGSGSIISRALGQCDQKNASIHTSIGFFSSFVFGLLVTAAGFIFLDDIIMILGSTETIAPYAKTYITYILISSPFMTSSLTMNNILRYEGKASLGMIGLMSGAVINIVGDAIFMFGFNMGIGGAGLSTAISQIISWLILLSMFIKRKTETKLSFKLIKDGSLYCLFNIMATGFPSLLRQGLNSFTTVLLNAQCAEYGDAAVSAMSIVTRIIFFAFSIALGIGQGFQPVSGFNYGAKKYERLKKALWFVIFAAEAIIMFGCLILVIFSSELIGIFRNDPNVIEIGSKALKLQAIAQITLPPCMAVEMLYQSTGKKLGASILSSMRNGVIFIPALLLMSHFRGLEGIQEAQPLSLILAFPVAVPFYLSFFKKINAQTGSKNKSTDKKNLSLSS